MESWKKEGKMQSNNNIDTTIHLSEVNGHGMKGNAFLFLPPINKEVIPAMAFFAHGYTSHKGSLLNWGSRLADLGVPTVLFDLPGHYLGSFHCVPSFEVFRDHAHELFFDAFGKLKRVFLENFPLDEHKVHEDELTLILGGHSLGALLALKALELPSLMAYKKKLGIAVGLGMSISSGDKTHLFETDFYKKTLNIRQQLVDQHLHPNNVFPWIKKEKEDFNIQGKTILLLTGQDDVVAPQNNVQEFGDRLKQLNNQVTIKVSKRLPHHQPEMAASPISEYLHSQGILSPK